MSIELTQGAKVEILETADIGGTTTAAVGNWATWLDMQNFHRVTGIVELGAWNASDDLDECRFQQAKDAAGTGAKDLTSNGSGKDYDTDNPVDADGDQVILDVRADQLDAQNGFRYVRLIAGEGGDTGVDNISGVIVRHAAKDKFKDLHKAPVAGSVVYVRKA